MFDGVTGDYNQAKFTHKTDPHTIPKTILQTHWSWLPQTIHSTPLQPFRIIITLGITSLWTIIQTLRSVNMKYIWLHLTFPSLSNQLMVSFMSIISNMSNMSVLSSPGPCHVSLIHQHTFSLHHIPPNETCSDSSSIPSLTYPPDVTEFSIPALGKPPFFLLCLSVCLFLSLSLSLSI